MSSSDATATGVSLYTQKGRSHKPTAKSPSSSSDTISTTSPTLKVVRRPVVGRSGGDAIQLHATLNLVQQLSSTNKAELCLHPRESRRSREMLMPMVRRLVVVAVDDTDDVGISSLFSPPDDPPISSLESCSLVMVAHPCRRRPRRTRSSVSPFMSNLALTSRRPVSTSQWPHKRRRANPKAGATIEMPAACWASGLDGGDIR